MVDTDLVIEPASTARTPSALLTGLLLNNQIEVFRYADDGPPVGTPEFTPTWSAVSYPIGWVVVTPAPADAAGNVSHFLTWSNGAGVTCSAISGNLVEVAANDAKTAAYPDLSGAEARQRRMDAATAARAAKELKADLYITDRPYLHAKALDLADGVTFCTVADALAIIGLYLRSQSVFTIWDSADGKSREDFDRGMFYLLGAHDLLNEGRRWSSLCAAQDRTQGADELSYLAVAVFQRSARTLRARDDLLRAANLPPDSGTAESAMTALDTCLIFLVGALDAVARVAHRVLDLPQDEHLAAWQRCGWIRSVESKAPSLAAAVCPGTAEHDTLTVLSKLRNTVMAPG